MLAAPLGIGEHVIGCIDELEILGSTYIATMTIRMKFLAEGLVGRADNLGWRVTGDFEVVVVSVERFHALLIDGLGV